MLGAFCIQGGIMQNEELIHQIELSRLRPFPDHPFIVRDDDAMQQTVESIRDYGSHPRCCQVAGGRHL